MYNFNVSYGISTKIITILVFAILLGFLAKGIFTKHISSIVGIIMLAIVLVLTIYLWAPRRYSIDRTNISIHRGIGDIQIPLSEVKDVRKDPSGFFEAIRVFGVGGMFGYYGRFYSGKLGHYTAYVTNGKNAVIIESKKVKYMISPNNPEAFVNRVKQMIASTNYEISTK